METQLQIYLIVGIGSFFIAALILTSSLLVYYVMKLYKKISEEQKENSYLRKHGVGISNAAVNMDDELSRRYTMHTPEPRSSLHIVNISQSDDKSLKRSNNKDSLKSINVNHPRSSSVVDVSEEFKWQGSDLKNSKYNSNITLENRQENFISIHESRTAFNDRSF